MQQKSKAIPVNAQSNGTGNGVFITRMSFNGKPGVAEVEQAHRDDWHLFLLQEKGTTTLDIDFERQIVRPGSFIYIHPSQVHRLVGFKNATVSNWMIEAEHLKPEYLRLLEELRPVKALALNKETASVLADAVTLGIRIAARETEKLHRQLLRDSCNTLVALIISQYLEHKTSKEKSSRFEAVTQRFSSELERCFETLKSPAEYARTLNVSVPYLNECVRKATGYPVSHHIRHRVILEARRLLYHSDKSVKEIAADLGYDDYSYFTRVFSKETGMTPSAFRAKNLDLS
jgi:AraC family transcriptional activator of pobA